MERTLNSLATTAHFGQISIGRTGTPDRTHRMGYLKWLPCSISLPPNSMEARDYRDIAAILKNGTSLSEGLGAAAAMYAPNFQPSEALKALECIEGGDPPPGREEVPFPHPVFRNPAAIPLMVAAIARFTSGVSSPARFRRSMSTWIRCIGSTYGFRSLIDRASTWLPSSSSA